MQVCALIPCYHHRHRLAQTLMQLRQYDLPCLVIDDGSEPDDAAAIAHICEQAGDGVQLIRHDRNRGKGAAVMTGFQAAATQGFSHALQIDADGQHDTQDIPRFLNQAQASPEAVITGIPQYDQSVPRHRLYARYLTHAWVWIETLSLELKDTMCGFRLYPLSAIIPLIQQVNIGQRMDFDTDILVRLYWQGIPVIQQPTRVIYPQDGRSNFRPWQDNLLISWMHTRLVCGMLKRQGLRLWPKRRQTVDPQQGRPSQPTTPSIHWAKTRERGSLKGLMLMSWLYRHGGRPLFKGVLYFVVAYFFLTGRNARQASADYLQRLYQFTGGTSPKPSLKQNWQHFLNFSQAIIARLDAWHQHGQITPQVDTQAPDTLKQHLSTGKGIFILVSHMGNIELCRALAEHKSLRLNILLHSRNAEKINQVVRSIQPDTPIRLIQVDDIDPSTSIDLAQRIEAGEWVIMAADRTPVSGAARTFEIPFLGQPALFPQGPFILASLMRCPVYSMFCLKTGAHQWQVHWHAIADHLNGPRKTRWSRLQHAGETYVAQLEQACQRQPLQWFNFYDFWARPHSMSPTQPSAKQDHTL